MKITASMPSTNKGEFGLTGDLQSQRSYAPSVAQLLRRLWQHISPRRRSQFFIAGFDDI